jgi:hypothetical protein
MSDVPVPMPLLANLTTRPARQVIEVLVSEGYHPDRIQAVAGRPIRLVFRRTVDDPCMDRIVFSSPRLERHLAPRSTTVVDLPASQEPEIRFTCGMGRYHGRIELTTDGASSSQRRVILIRVLAATGAAIALSSGFVPFAGVVLVAMIPAVLSHRARRNGGRGAGHDRCTGWDGARVRAQGDPAAGRGRRTSRRGTA